MIVIIVAKCQGTKVVRINCMLGRLCCFQMHIEQKDGQELKGTRMIDLRWLQCDGVLLSNLLPRLVERGKSPSSSKLQPQELRMSNDRLNGFPIS